MSCGSCYEISLPTCTDIITVKMGLTAAANYTWIITDKFGKKYSKEVTTDGAGFLTIDLDDLPEGLLTEYAGTFNLKVINAIGETVSFEYNDITYECVDFTMFASDGSLDAIIPDPGDVITPPNVDPQPTEHMDQTPNNGAYNLLVGAVDGSNALFTTSQAGFVSGLIKVYLDGVLQQQGSPSGDYVETNAAIGTFTFNNPPPIGSIITAIYFK